MSEDATVPAVGNDSEEPRSLSIPLAPRFHVFHRWTKWWPTKINVTFNGMTDGRKDSGQERYCTLCNKHELRRSVLPMLDIKR